MSYTLVCIIIGDKIPFAITGEKFWPVGELEKEIKRNKENGLTNVEATDLMLYKANIDISNREECNNEVYNLSKHLTNAEMKLFDPRQELSKIFQSLGPPEGKINILAQLPEGESIDSFDAVALVPECMVVDSWRASALGLVAECKQAGYDC